MDVPPLEEDPPFFTNLIALLMLSLRFRKAEKDFLRRMESSGEGVDASRECDSRSLAKSGGSGRGSTSGGGGNAVML